MKTLGRHGIGRDEEDIVFHLEGESMHSMTTNDERFYDKYDKFIHDFLHMKNMTWQR